MLRSKSFVLRLLLILSGIILAAAGIKVFYLFQMIGGEDYLAKPSISSFYLGILLIDGIMLLGLWGIIWKIYRIWMQRPIMKLAPIIEELQVEHIDMVSYLRDTECDEIHLLSQAAISMLRQVKSLLNQLNDAGQNILDASQTAFSASKNQSMLLASQVNSSDEMAAAIRELVLTTQHISEDVNAVVEIANQTLHVTEQGHESVMNVVESMEDIRHSSQVSSNKIIALSKQSGHINEVVKTIDRIIEDTKLIAFNATIEAVRAKDEGRGFSVVALEIKRLAEEVFESTEDIKELIQEIQSASHALVLATEDEMKTVHRGAQLAEEAGTSFKQIFDMVKLTTESAQRIAAATQQQRGTSEQVLQSVETANHSINKFSHEAKQLAVTAAELSILAEGLEQILSKFGHIRSEESLTR